MVIQLYLVPGFVCSRLFDDPHPHILLGYLYSNFTPPLYQSNHFRNIFCVLFSLVIWVFAKILVSIFHCDYLSTEDICSEYHYNSNATQGWRMFWDDFWTENLRISSDLFLEKFSNFFTENISLGISNFIELVI